MEVQLEVKLEVSDMVFFRSRVPAPGPKNTSKNTTIRHLHFHLQNPNLPEGGFNRRTDYSMQASAARQLGFPHLQHVYVNGSFFFQENVQAFS